MKKGIRFVMLAVIKSKQIKKLLIPFASNVTKLEFAKVHNGHAYSVCECTLGIIAEGDGYSYVADDDLGFDGSEFKIRVYVCCDSKKCRDDEKAEEDTY